MASRPVRYFDGVDDRIGLAAGALVAEPPLTVGVVCRRIGMPSAEQFMLSLSEVGVDAYVTWGFTATGAPATNYLQLNGRWADSPAVTLAATDLWAVVFASYDYDGTIRVSRKKLPDGTWVHGNGWAVAPDVASHAIDAVYLGCYHGVSDFFRGNVAAAGVWDRVLTDGERNGISAASSGSDGWLASNPLAMWDLGQAAIEEGVVDLTANGADEVELDGTSVAIEDVPWALPSPPSAEKVSVLTSAGWHELTGPPGPAGSPGPRGLKGDRGDVSWQGDWLAESGYTRGDAVSFDGSSYVAEVPATGAAQPPTDSAFWSLLAAEGDVGPEGPQGTPGTPITPTPVEPWHEVGTAGEPAFTAPWTNYAGGYETVGFRKTPDGRVILKGLATHPSSASQVIFVLPVGYRPAAAKVFTNEGSSAPALNYSRFDVLANGEVRSSVSQAAGAIWASLEGIAFYVEPAVWPSGPKGDKGDPGPQGTFLGVQEDHATVDVYSPNFSGTHNVQKDTNVLLQLTYVPPVDAWWEILGFIGTVQKMDAVYHYASLNLVVAPAPEFWPVSASQIVAADNKTQHSTVQQYEPREIKRRVALKGGVSYQTYMYFGISGGSWRYSRSAYNCWIEGKAWAR